MRQIIVYSDTEKSIVLRCLQQYPDNLAHAFRVASEELEDRTPAAIAYQYYNKWKFQEDFNAITVGSKRGFTKNVKNTKRREGVFPEDRNLNTVEWLMKELLGLTRDDRDRILGFFS